MNTGEQLFLQKDGGERLEREFELAPLLKAFLDCAPLAMNVWNGKMENIMCNRHVLDIFKIDDGNQYLENFYKFSPMYQPNGITSEEMSKICFGKVIEEGYNTFSWMHQTLSGEEVPSKITLFKIKETGQDIYIVGFVQDLRYEFSSHRVVDYDYYFTDIIPQSVLIDEMSDLSDEWFFSLDLRTGNFHYYGNTWSNNISGQSTLTESEMFELGLIHKDDIELYKEMIGNLKSGKNETYDIRFLTNDSYRYSKIACKVIKDPNGNPVFAVGKGSDIHEQKIFEERSQKDLLTNCYNKISSENIIEEKLKTLKNGSHAFFIVDIDNFKGINDNLGHFFGDEVLREISASLKATFRDIDIVARIGGDEFTVFVEHITDIEIVKMKAEKILEVYSRTYAGSYSEYSISGSVGISRYPKDGTTYSELYQNADKALNQAKIMGKNRFVIYTDDLDVGTTRSITKIENANRIASSFFDYELISAVFNILYEKNGNDESINEALKYLCQKYNADRSYIFETLDGGLSYSNTFEFCKDGISAEIENLQELPVELFVDFIDKSHNDIIYSNDLRETFEHEGAFELMANQDILSFAHAQVKREGEMTFFIGLDDCTKTRVWSEREINSLQYIGKLISIILQGANLRREVDKLLERNTNSAHILDSSDNIVYVSDIETSELLYLNKTALAMAGNPTKEQWQGKKCSEVLPDIAFNCDNISSNFLIENDYIDDKYYEWSVHSERLDKTFLIKEKLIPYNGKLAKLDIATNVSELTKLEQKLKERLEDEQFITNCVGMLHTDSDPASSIYSLLAAVTNYFDSERSYIFEISQCGNYISNTFEYCANGAQPFKEHLQNLPIADLSLLLNKCDEHGSFCMNIDEALRSKNTLEYELMSMQNLTDIVVGSIRLDGSPITGFVGVDNPKKNKEKIGIIRSVSKFTASFLDATELVAKLNNLSYYDTLTGIKNRHSYNSALKEIDSKEITSLGIAYIDILGLSSINETRGIMFGDNVLITLANTLMSIFGSSVFRVGGDEFVVLLENIEEMDFERDIVRLKEKLSESHDFRASIGYTWNKNLETASNGFDKLYYGEKYSRILCENLDMEISNGKYIVYLQPQVDFADGKVKSAEALIRRVGAEGALQPPISFVPFYEKEGIISKIDTFVVDTVCKTLREWQDEGKTEIAAVAVNCSRTTIAEQGIVEKFSEICKKHGVSPSRIVIEITETINGINEQALTNIIERFSDAGFLISLDDFGSGYSNLTSLVMSDFDEIKIDMKLINDIHQNPKSKALTEVAITLCSKLDNLMSIAEGVEVAEQCDILKEMGCNKGQGYYFDKPMPIEQFKEKYVM